MQFAQYVRCETVELIKNGGFEDGLNYWRSVGYGKCSVNATVTSSQAHSGRYSLDIKTGEVTEMECIGSYAFQYVDLPKGIINLSLSFWFYSPYVGLSSSRECFAMIIGFWAAKAPRFLVYNVFWDPDMKFFKDFPPTSKSTQNVTNIMIYRLTAYQWNHIERNLTEDFKKYYPNDNFNDVHGMTIMMIAIGQYVVNPVHAYWDDISLTCKLAEPPKTPVPTATPTPTLTSTPTLPPTQTTPTKPQQTTPQSQIFQKERYIDTALIGIVVAVLIVASCLPLFTKRSKTETAESHPPPVKHEKHPLITEYDKLSIELNSNKQKLTKLTDLYAEGKISEESYKTLKTEYEITISKIEKSINDLKNKIGSELNSLSEEESKTIKELDLLEAKNIVGDITKEQYLKDKSILEARLSEIKMRKTSLTILQIK